MKRLFAVALIVAACQPAEKKVIVISESHFESGIARGKVDARLAEASGLVASKVNPGMLWTHNDSGNPAEVFLIDTLAQIKRKFILWGVENRDWEDITIGAGPDSTKTYLYVGDIGDNAAIYPGKIIYRFEEPLLSSRDSVIRVFNTLHVNLADGVRDSEAMMIDPLTKNMYLFSKREDSVHMYAIHFPYPNDTIKATYQITLPYHNINAADISSDGTEVLIKDYDNIYYWKRTGQESIQELLQMPAINLPYQKEVQGESITFDRNGRGFYTLSESSIQGPASLLFYKRK